MIPFDSCARKIYLTSGQWAFVKKILVIEIGRRYSTSGTTLGYVLVPTRFEAFHSPNKMKSNDMCQSDHVRLCQSLADIDRENNQLVFLACRSETCDRKTLTAEISGNFTGTSSTVVSLQHTDAHLSRICQLDAS